MTSTSQTRKKGRFKNSLRLFIKKSHIILVFATYLEKDDLIKVELRQRKRFFALTDKGEKITRTILNSYREISNYSAYLFITSLGIEKPG